MKKFLSTLLVSMIVLACQNQEKSKTIPAENVKENDTTANVLSIEQKTEQLKEKGYQVFHYKEGDSTYLMQQYYMVFLKEGKNRHQDSTEIAKLQQLHLTHLNRMATEGYASLVGPFGDDGKIRGVVIYNTATQQEADSLAHLDPMVKAGRLEVEIHPWWTEKGGKLH